MPNLMIKLTAPQQRMLDDVRRDGVRRYNGRAVRTIKALRAAGFVSTEMTLVPQAGGKFSELWIVVPGPVDILQHQE